MPNTDGPKGFIPATSPGGNIRQREYAVDSSNATALYIGDLVVRESDGNVIGATAGNGNYILGAITACYDSDRVPVSSLATTTAGYVLVADDPQQLFIAQDDGDTTQLALTDRGATLNAVGTAGTGSSTSGYRSGMEIDSSSAGTTTDDQLKLIDIHDVEGNTVGANCKWIVKINLHQDADVVLGQAI